MTDESKNNIEHIKAQIARYKTLAILLETQKPIIEAKAIDPKEKAELIAGIESRISKLRTAILALESKLT